jgi:hypothetical protein
VRIRATLSTPFKKKVRGELQLLCGDRVRFTATAVRREEGETVFKFTDSIGTAFLIGEKKAMAAVAEKPPGTI